MKCENCDMNFFVADYNKQKECPHCGHIHGDVSHTHEENNMAKKIVKWVWNLICWPWKKLVEWLWTR